MKTIHIHIAVHDLAKNIEFYSTLFASPPSVLHDDYAKWQLEEPAINFALSQTSQQNNAVGIQHFGIQVTAKDELTQIEQRLDQASIQSTEQLDTHCCHAISNKLWTKDPQNINWEMFQTTQQLSQAEVINDHRAATTDTSTQPDAINKSGCCQ